MAAWLILCLALLVALWLTFAPESFAPTWANPIGSYDPNLYASEIVRNP